MYLLKNLFKCDTSFNQAYTIFEFYHITCGKQQLNAHTDRKTNRDIEAILQEQKLETKTHVF